MAKNAIQYPLQIITDAKKDICAGIDNMSNYELIGVSTVLGLAVVFAPHILALNGALSLIGSVGRASTAKDCGMKYGCEDIEFEPAVGQLADVWEV
jgi:hypothetical protein